MFYIYYFTESYLPFFRIERQRGARLQSFTLKGLMILITFQFWNSFTQLENTRGAMVIWCMEDEMSVILKKLTSSCTLRNTKPAQHQGAHRSWPLHSEPCYVIYLRLDKVGMPCICMSGSQHKSQGCRFIFRKQGFSLWKTKHSQ